MSEAEHREVEPGPGAPGGPADGEVRVWRVRLQRLAGSPEVPLTALSAAERHRAARFRRAEGARRWVSGRLVLRRLLGDCLGVPGGDLPIVTDPFGRPMLADGYGGRLRWNVARCDDLALYALCVGREVGIDLERVRPEIEALALAERFFAAAEIAALRDVPPADRAEAFCRVWTRKEAYVKAIGRGLSTPLDCFSVPVGPVARSRLLAHADGPEEAERWELLDVPAFPGHLAAVAVECGALLPAPRLVVGDWEPGGAPGPASVPTERTA